MNSPFRQKEKKSNTEPQKGKSFSPAHYSQELKVRHFCLCYLPASHIMPAFHQGSWTAGFADAVRPLDIPPQDGDQDKKVQQAHDGAPGVETMTEIKNKTEVAVP